MLAAAAALALACGPAAGPAPRPTPASGPEIMEAVRAAAAPATLVNVWATWYIPCREEFPDLLRLRSEYARHGLELVLVCADFDREDPAIGAFLKEQGVDFPSYFKTGGDEAFIEALDPGWSGALPGSFLFDAGGVLRHTWEGKTTYGQLEETVQEALQGREVPRAKENGP